MAYGVCPGFRGPGEALVLDTEDVRAFEANSAWLGVPLTLLMENAGRAVADAVECRLGGVEGRRVVAFAGRGGNGGDAIVAARHLAARGARVEVVLVYPDQLYTHPDTRLNLDALRRSGYARVRVARGPGDLEPVSADAVIDGVLGIGVRGRLREPAASAARAVSESGGLRVAVDVPTGVDPDTGEAAPGAASVDVTVTFHAMKPGLARPPGSMHAGEVLVAEVGMPPQASELAGPGDVAARIPPRPRDAHKGVGGRVLVVGGSSLYYGAAALAALAAYRAGADLAFLAAPERVAVAAASWSPVIIPRPLEGGRLEARHVDSVLEEASRAHAVLVGPGLGLAGETVEAVGRLLGELRGRPVVVDADALKAVARLGVSLWPEAILTPHRGEARLLLGGEEAEPGEAARRIAREYQATVIVKGPVDHICSPSGGCRRNTTGVPAMATGGTGDVLSGVAAAFLARRASLGLALKPLHTAAAAAYTVGRAGELAYEALGEGMTALDVASKVAAAVEEARRAPLHCGWPG
ncbi:MAG: NAD(P)H-hydrate dehydratase [Desulfurococcales archaeon]|nr:NAD(P)H-hydrate dehydratase [Desulfurococcales archaeon]